MENTGDYVTLVRLAAHFGCTLPLVGHTTTALEEFKKTQVGKIPEWLRHYARTEEEDYDFLGAEPLLTTEEYTPLEEAAEELLHSLDRLANQRQLFILIAAAKREASNRAYVVEKEIGLCGDFPIHDHIRKESARANALS